MGEPTPPALTAAAPAPYPVTVPVAWLGRTSTLELQDPRASLCRQLRVSAGALPAGLVIAAHFWDIESGGKDIEQRGHGAAGDRAGVDIPRDGGLDDLLAEAAAPRPRFAAVICENIERSGRDSFNALKLERALADQGIVLLAADEPISLEGMNSTGVLVRRVKQSVAEWYRLQLREAVWKGLREHSLDGWNIGTPPYGYLGDRQPHPAPHLAAQGRTKTRLVPDPGRAPVVARIFGLRVYRRLGCAQIARILAADPAVPAPPAGWTRLAVWKILSNPKYTGYMVWGRRRTQGRRTRATSPAEWLWTPQPVHEAIITRQMWHDAQAVGAEHQTSRDDLPADVPRDAAGRRTYTLRSRVRCHDCNRRLAGATRFSSRYYKPGTPDAILTYYRCTHDAASPRQAAALPDHPATVLVREDALLAAITQFLDERIFGPERAALLAAAYPADAAARDRLRDTTASKLRRQLARNEKAQDAHARELLALATTSADPRAIEAMRTRTLDALTTLQHDRAALTTQLDQLTAPSADDGPGNAALLDQLPALAGRLADAPPRLIAQLLDALNINAVYNKTRNRAVIYATITPATPRALTALAADSHPTTPAPVSLFVSPTC
jgi:site-specific DNA recombinase